MNELIFGSEGMGRWGDCILFPLIKHFIPEITIKNDNSASIILSSFFFNIEPEWNTEIKKYIYFSGEPRNDFKIKNNVKYLIASTVNIKNRENFLYIPYVLVSPHLYKKRLFPNKNRKYFIGYCSKNKVKEREEFFNLCVEKSINIYCENNKYIYQKGSECCHALSVACGKYPESKLNKPIPGGWGSKALINSYSNYKFVIASENSIKDGYVTEKILNAFYSGAIPVYWGTEKVKDFFNPKSFIYVNDFDSFEDCVDYINNMTEKQIEDMSKEPIYNENNDIINLFNSEYNKKGNPTLNRYLTILKDFILK